MMGSGKYVVFDEQHILIFDPAQEHSAVARNAWGTPTSAGFIQIGVREGEYGHEPVIACYGKSTSLGMESNPKLDEALARFALGLNR